MEHIAEKWDKICRNPLLKDLPYKIQTDKWGNIMMSPASNEHGILQARIVAKISRLTDNGVIITECSVQTVQGVKVADVTWASDDFMERNRGKTPFDEAPDICMEILSPSNSEQEMNEKKELYFAAGAKEFWLFGPDGRVKIFMPTGQTGQSAIISNFPEKI